jgi:hypothetical protein
MLSIGVVGIGGLLWYGGYYTLAFWLVIFATVSGLGAVAKAIANPHWYAAGRAQAGLETDLFNPSKGIRSLIATKVITTAVLAFCAWKLGQQAGYFQSPVPVISAEGEVWVREIGEATNLCVAKFELKFGESKDTRFADCMTDQTHTAIQTCIGRSDFSTCVSSRSLVVMRACDTSRC